MRSAATEQEENLQSALHKIAQLEEAAVGQRGCTLRRVTPTPDDRTSTSRSLSRMRAGRPKGVAAPKKSAQPAKPTTATVDLTKDTTLVAPTEHLRAPSQPVLSKNEDTRSVRSTTTAIRINSAQAKSVDTSRDVPEPVTFEGDKSKFSSWYTKMTNKPRATTFRSHEDGLSYIQQFLSGPSSDLTAIRTPNDLTLCHNTFTKVEEMLELLKKNYADTNAAGKDMQAMVMLQQDKDESFSAFYAKS
jgi:hypothetical protein